MALKVTTKYLTTRNRYVRNLLIMGYCTVYCDLLWWVDSTYRWVCVRTNLMPSWIISPFIGFPLLISIVILTASIAFTSRTAAFICSSRSCFSSFVNSFRMMWPSVWKPTEKKHKKLIIRVFSSYSVYLINALICKN